MKKSRSKMNLGYQDGAKSVVTSTVYSNRHLEDKLLTLVDNLFVTHFERAFGRVPNNDEILNCEMKVSPARPATTRYFFTNYLGPREVLLFRTDTRIHNHTLSVEVTSYV